MAVSNTKEKAHYRFNSGLSLCGLAEQNALHKQTATATLGSILFPFGIRICIIVNSQTCKFNLIVPRHWSDHCQWLQPLRNTMKPITPTNFNARCHQSPMAIVGAILAFGVIRKLDKASTDRTMSSQPAKCRRYDFLPPSVIDQNTQSATLPSMVLCSKS